MFTAGLFPAGLFPAGLYPGVAGVSGPPADLLEAVVARLLADATVAADVGGRVWSFQGAHDELLPYLLISLISEYSEFSGPDGDGKIPYIDRQEFQVTAYAEDTVSADGLDLVRLVAKHVHDSLNDAPLAFEAGTLLEIRRTNRVDQIDPDLGPNGGRVYQGIITYEATIQRFL
jgi:hypothetical protein